MDHMYILHTRNNDSIFDVSKTELTNKHKPRNAVFFTSICELNNYLTSHLINNHAEIFTPEELSNSQSFDCPLPNEYWKTYESHLLEKKSFQMKLPTELIADVIYVLFHSAKTNHTYQIEVINNIQHCRGPPYSVPLQAITPTVNNMNYIYKAVGFASVGIIGIFCLYSGFKHAKIILSL